MHPTGGDRFLHPLDRRAANRNVRIERHREARWVNPQERTLASALVTADIASAQQGRV